MVLAVALVLVSAIDFAVDGVTALYLRAFSKRGKEEWSSPTFYKTRNSNVAQGQGFERPGARALSVPVS